jgi:hypothetical protein
MAAENTVSDTVDKILSGIDDSETECHGPTMSSELQHLRVLSDQVLRRLERNSDFITWRELEKTISTLERLAGTEPSRTSGPAKETIDEVTARYGKHARTPTVQLAAHIIDQKGEPVRTGALIEAMEEAGFQFRGSDPPNNLASVLGKSGIIKSVQIGPSMRDDRGWWFTGRPLPAHIKVGRLAELSKNGAAAILNGQHLVPGAPKPGENKNPTDEGGV